MTPEEGLEMVERVAGSLGEAGPFIGAGIALARRALADHGKEGGLAHLAALLEADAQAAARARWGWG